jgi:hypothetical protein
MGSDTAGAFYAFYQKDGNQNPMALGDGIPGAPTGDGAVEPVPPIGERDEYMRMEFSNVLRMPNWWQSTVSIYSLQTREGETKVYKRHYIRKFEIDGPKPGQGYFGIWARFGSPQFKNFTISHTDNR